jgi:RimJ/RimL family protein N-acetyltransferase
MTITFAVNSQLPENILATRKTLPVKPTPVTLEGRYVVLRPLDLARDLEPLYAVSNGQPVTLGDKSIEAYDAEKIIWRYMFAGPFANLDDFAMYFEGQVNAPNGLPYCVFDAATRKQVGVANYMNNFPEHLKIELGSIWYSPLVQRTHANTEATYLMLKNAFELGYRRLEWKCDAMNERSRRAAERMGFKYEGTQDAHMIINERNRDTAWFRILDSEWPDVQGQLEALLYST